jgi:ribonuclease G
MSKEIYISSTPHETRLAIVENEALAEIYYERENEYTLAGSIYNGRVTRVLPGMQSSFVDIGLERDAFLYITDFLEEAPDSEEFDTAPAGDRARNGDGGSRERSGRGRRGGRDRNRSDRNVGERVPGQEQGAPEGEFREAPYGETADSEFAAAEGGQADAEGQPNGGEGTAEGGRKWRGRRGRRRGRGNRAGQEGAAQAGSAEAQGDFAPASEDADIDSADFNASAEPSFEEMARPQHPAGDREQRSGRFAGRDRSQRDQNPAGRGYESRRDEGRGEGSGRRSSRGFESRREDYGVGDEPSGSGPVAGAYDAPPAGEEIFVLPGESLARLRPASEQTQAGVSSAVSSASSAPSMANAMPPATLYTLAEGWDGGAVLPGETIRPRGPQSRGSESQSFESAAEYRGGRRDRDGRRGRGGRRDDRRGNREDRPRYDDRRPHADEFAGVHTAAIPEAEAAPNTEPPVRDHAEIHDDFAGVRADAPHVETEYEPTEASASYRVDPAPPSEFRQSAPVIEEEEMEETEVAHDMTSISATGEMHSEVSQEVLQPAHQAELEAAAQTEPIRHEGAIVSQFQEEVLDEEANTAPTLHASSIEEMDDLDEETLEGAADLGTMLREMSIDQITRSQPDDEEDEDDDFEEDLLEEDELDEEDEEDGETGGFQQAEGETAPEAMITDAFEREESREEYEVIEGGADFTEGEEDHAETQAEGHANGANPDRSPGRDRSRDFGDRRRGRRGDRDRGRGRSDSGRGRMGHGDHRRSRASAQTTNLPAISDLLKPGQEILVQIAKEPIAKKGARITSHIALPGRFLVFMPTVNHTGVSRKIESDGERRRLKEILLSEKGDASGGFIVRTAAEGASEEELRSDLRFLLNLWADIKARSEGSKSPALIYHDLNLVERVLRDQVTDNFSAIWVDTEHEYERVLRFLQRFQPSLIRRVKLYLKETPLFEQFGITEEINKALRSKVWLKSGGSIVINQTEALVAIDINTGKYVGKTARLEDTIVKTNLDAIPEIVRQIRLRDLGGIIIIDFIDMDERKNRHRVMAALEEELKNDRAPSKVLQFNDFGLVAITRKRVKQSLERTLSTTCNVCTGTGMVKSPVTVCNDIYVELRKMHKHLERGDIMLRVHPEVVKQLKSSGSKWLQEMEEMAGKTILVKSDPSLHPEQFDIQ